MRFILLLSALFILNGCTQIISKESRDLVDSSVTFQNLKERPDAYIGKYVLLGGVITTVKNTSTGGELEIVQTELDNSRSPEDTVTSKGRFLAKSTNLLDPMIYRQGLKITMVGEVKGKEIRPLFQINYAYPVLIIKEMHLWKPEEEQRVSPTFHFGLGIGTYF